jgi:hypothetical protein
MHPDFMQHKNFHIAEREAMRENKKVAELLCQS